MGAGTAAGATNARSAAVLVLPTTPLAADSEPRGHRIEATAGVGPNNLVKGRVGVSEQMARQRNGGSEDADSHFLDNRLAGPGKPALRSAVRDFRISAWVRRVQTGHKDSRHT